jgi:hypothetical protein
MAYNPTWSNGDAGGRLIGGQHTVRLSDAAELAAAINRRRLLTFQGAQDFSSHLAAGAYVKEATFDSALSPPFDNFRSGLATSVLNPPTGSMGGVPPTPTAMEWLWPASDGDENKRLVSGYNPPGSNEVGLLLKINGTNHWTDANLQPVVTAIRDVHFNELRQAVEYVRRGRWDLPIYWMSGLFDLVPDAPWTAGVVSNSGLAELRNVGYAVFRDDSSPLRGLVGVTVRAGSFLEVTADADCTVEVRHCLRPLNFIDWLATWNEYNPGTSSAWSSPGGMGGGDSVSVGSVALAAGTPGQISGANLTAALQAIVDGAEQNFLIRRTDTGYTTVAVEARVVVEFDLDTPPN